MPKHLSLATVVEKNKIASAVPFVILMEIEVVNQDTGVYIETLRLARSDENITHLGQLYNRAAFDLKITESAKELPSVTMEVRDPTGSVMERAEEHKGCVGWKVRLKYVNTAQLDQPAEIEELVYVISATARRYSIEFGLGARNPLAQRFPRRMQRRDRCGWLYKSPECGYSGVMPTCDYSLQGTNGCAAHDNTLRFGAYPGIRQR